MCTDSAGTATSDILIENDRVRVTRWSFAGRGDNTGWHRHAHDYVVVPEFDGNLEVLLPGGETVIAPQTNGTPYFREIGGEHDVINGNDYPISFVEIEMLDRKG
ncbi:MAG: cupin [Paracoccaceae bacterium]